VASLKPVVSSVSWVELFLRHGSSV
jgi:hypothetical protein